MWHMPNIPPKKAHLEFLLKCAALKLRQSELEAEDWTCSGSELGLCLTNELETSCCGWNSILLGICISLFPYRVSSTLLLSSLSIFQSSMLVISALETTFLL